VVQMTKMTLIDENDTGMNLHVLLENIDTVVLWETTSLHRR
jgi:hypothetical protein